jgi:N-acetylglucosaminyl-diphospho-decaprenol L-rhamnosyltransferase
MDTGVLRLAVIIVSANSARWLRPCLASLFNHAHDVDLDVVVVASGCTDETISLVEREFPKARTVACENRGFAYANNRALRTVESEWVLFLNPDTEILEGTLAGLLHALRAHPFVGLVGVRQVTPDGQVFPTIRRFPNAVRAFFEAVGSEGFPFRASWLGERELDLRVYESDVPCDWTSGSFMLARWEALQSAGFMDERFFLYSEETDLCLRIRQAGWDIRHLPIMTILHHAVKAGANPRLAAQAALARKLYGRKHFSPAHSAVYVGALALTYAIRAVSPGGDRAFAVARRSESRSALATLLGLKAPPFGAPPPVAVAPTQPPRLATDPGGDSAAGASPSGC